MATRGIGRPQVASHAIPHTALTPSRVGVSSQLQASQVIPLHFWTQGHPLYTSKSSKSYPASKLTSYPTYPKPPPLGSSPRWLPPLPTSCHLSLIWECSLFCQWHNYLSCFPVLSLQLDRKLRKDKDLVRKQNVSSRTHSGLRGSRGPVFGTGLCRSLVP